MQQFVSGACFLAALLSGAAMLHGQPAARRIQPAAPISGAITGQSKSEISATPSPGGFTSATQLDFATIAAMQLSEDPSYSWTSSVDDGARSYLKQGKHIRGGYTWVVLPMLDSISRRLGRYAGTDIEAIFKGDECVIRLGDRWKTVRQLPRASAGAEEPYVVMPAPSGFGPEDPFPPVIIITPPRASEEEKPYSNARLAASAPHEELALIVSSWTQVTVDGNSIRGLLTDTGARLLLCPGSDVAATPLAAAGEFAIALKGGRVSRYALKLEGVLRVGKKQLLVRQTSDTAVTAVGATSFVAPDEARLKLGH